MFFFTAPSSFAAARKAEKELDGIGYIAASALRSEEGGMELFLVVCVGIAATLERYLHQFCDLIVGSHCLCPLGLPHNDCSLL